MQHWLFVPIENGKTRNGLVVCFGFEDLESTVYLPWKISTTKGDR